jgi:hypothetical protein
LPVYSATIDCVVDEGIGHEDFEDPEDFVEPGKQPFDHDYETSFCMAYSTLFLDDDHVDVVSPSVGCLRYFLVDTCIVHDPTSL